MILITKTSDQTRQRRRVCVKRTSDASYRLVVGRGAEPRTTIRSDVGNAGGTTLSEPQKSRSRKVNDRWHSLFVSLLPLTIDPDSLSTICYSYTPWKTFPQQAFSGESRALTTHADTGHPSAVSMDS